MPANLGRTFTAVAKYDAASFKVTLGKAAFTVAPVTEIRGRVVDHTGAPVAGAKVFLGGHGSFEMTNGELERFDGPKTVTDADGRFLVHGAKGKATRVIVSAPSLQLWNAPLPQEGESATIRLPQPARLVLKYDIEGDVPEVQGHVHMKTWEMADWKGVVEFRPEPTVPNGGQVVLDGLPPGPYDVARQKMVRVGDCGYGTFCDRRFLTLAAGETKTVEFVRRKAYPITGSVTGLPEGGVPGVLLIVRPFGGGDGLVPGAFDALRCDPNGRFRTVPIPPGRYTIEATASKPLPRSARFSTGLRRPDFVGSADVTVPEDRPPAAVTIRMGGG